MKQMTLARGGFERFGKITEARGLLGREGRGHSWTQLCALIEPHDPKL